MSSYSIDGPVAVLPARVCAVLESALDLRQLREVARARGDLEVHDALQALRAVALQYVDVVAADISASDARSGVAPTSEVPGRSDVMVLGSFDVAIAAHVSPRAVTLAASKGRLRGVLAGGRWWFNPDDVAMWLATRTKERAA